MASRRDLIRMNDVEISEFIGGRRTMNVASFGPDGNIHLVAMWYGFLGSSNTYEPGEGYDGSIVIETFGKSQKVQNFRRDRRFSAIIEAGDQYDELRGVELVGTVEIFDDPAVVFESCKAVLSRYETFETSEDLEFAAGIAANKRVCLRLNVNKTVSWDHTKLDVQY